MTVLLAIYSTDSAVWKLKILKIGQSHLTRPFNPRWRYSTQGDFKALLNFNFEWFYDESSLLCLAPNVVHHHHIWIFVHSTVTSKCRCLAKCGPSTVIDGQRINNKSFLNLFLVKYDFLNILDFCLSRVKSYLSSSFYSLGKNLKIQFHVFMNSGIWKKCSFAVSITTFW